MFSKILVATDGSEHAKKALRVGGNVANRYGARLYVAHVVTDQPVPDSLRRLVEMEHLIDEAQDTAAPLGTVSMQAAPADQARLAAAVGSKVIEQGLLIAQREGATDATPLELHGDAARAITEAVADAAIDLLVVGSRGFGPIGRLVHGSVSSKLLQDARCPCLVVK